MAVDHAQRARWAHRVLRLREAGFQQLSYDDAVSTADSLPVPDEVLDE